MVLRGLGCIARHILKLRYKTVLSSPRQEYVMSADVGMICTGRIRPSTGISVLWETEQSK